MKITTKTGDAGETGLFAGKRVSKSSFIINSLGDLDELHSFLGFCRFGTEVVKREDLIKAIARIQDDLYRMMGVIGFEMKCPPTIKEISDDDVLFLEDERAKFTDIVGDLSKFIRPGTTEDAARFHLARAVCRRAERSLVSLGDKEDIKMPEVILKYVNRLSDLLFVIAYSFEKHGE